jgi:hypothetical protein
MAQQGRNLLARPQAVAVAAASLMQAILQKGCNRRLVLSLVSQTVDYPESEDVALQND